MVKTLAVCAALCIAAVGLPRFRPADADRAASARARATGATRVGVRNAPRGEPYAAPASPDGGLAEPQAAAARDADRLPTVALGTANAGWSTLFNR